MKKIFLLMLIGIFLIGIGSAQYNPTSISFNSYEENCGGNTLITPAGIVNSTVLIDGLLTTYLTSNKTCKFSGNYRTLLFLNNINFSSINIPSNASNVTLNIIKTNQYDGGGTRHASGTIRPAGYIQTSEGSELIYSTKDGLFSSNFNASIKIIYGIGKRINDGKLFISSSDAFLQPLAFWTSNITTNISEIYLTYQEDNMPPKFNSNITNGQIFIGGLSTKQIIFGANATDNLMIGTTERYNVDTTTDEIIKACMYSLNGGGNNTFTCNNNGLFDSNTITISNLGWNNISFFVYDDAGTMASESKSFFYTSPNYTLSNIVSSTPVIETSTNNFSINLSYDSNYYASANAVLYYNNTIYPSTKSGTGNNIRFTNSVKAPLVNADTNVSFYWTVALSNSSGTFYYNSTVTNQTVRNFTINDCAVAGTIKLFNFTMVDEDTRIRLLTPTWNQTYAVETYIDNTLWYSNNKTNVNEFSLCSNINVTSALTLDLLMRYDGDGTGTGYVTEYYNIQSYNLINTTANQNITLYSLKGTSSDEFLITLKDSNYLPLTDSLIEITRKYISDGTFKIVEIPKSDSLGKAIGHFVVNDEIYTINVRKNGLLLASYENIQLYCLTGVDCTLNLNIPSASSLPSSFIGYGNLLYNVEYDDDTKLYTMNFITNDGSATTVNLDMYVNNVNVCSQELTQSSGALICALTSYGNQTARAVIRSDGVTVAEDTVNVGYKKSSFANPIRFLIAGALIPMFVLMGASSVGMGIIFFILGLILAGGLFMFDTQGWLGTGSFIAFFVIGILIIGIKVVWGRNNG